ncbi:MAG: transcription elongation factor GreA [Chloroflexota bacterium]|nr:transcription elongation factor GreA [Chloroflexota bacterium]
MNAQKPVYVTAEGLAALKVELTELTKEKRPALAKRLHIAIKQGDLSENADYITAKEEQGFLEGRVQELEYKIRHAQLITENTSKDGRIHLGSRVAIQEAGTDLNESYQLVGATEADPRQGKISNESPLGRMLLGKKVGETVTVSAPAGELRFSITDID